MSDPTTARTHYLSTFEGYLKGEQETRKKLDELSIAGAAGSLGLSIAFLDKIARNPSAASRPVLLVAWCLMLASIAVALINMELGTLGYATARDELTRSYSDNDGFNAAVVQRWNRWIVAFNRLSFLLLFAGACVLVGFAYVNLIPSPTAATSATMSGPTPSPNSHVREQEQPTGRK
jgi:hypothetical protein